ncbi:MAG: MBL fold metallo-hydrolase [Candidatus Bathyarchaeia archaeon]|jgi:7,8-dihydropterin-6-yl-methyl-4-(beta-D-ribofuranosyl)aminobenzene 5'-phosphate synthase
MESTKQENLVFKEVDAVEIFSMVDNSVDFLSPTYKDGAYPLRQWTKKRYGEDWMHTHPRLPKGEHGFSMLIHTLNKGRRHSVLFDTGCSGEGIVENASRMGVDLTEIECIVLSHGHWDHTGGLRTALKAISKKNLPIVIHEEMFTTRGSANPDGSVRKYASFPSKEQLNDAQLIETKQPFAIVDDEVLVTGEIPRETSFEQGYLQHRCLKEGTWKPDPLIVDERAVVINVKGKGLVVVSGCAHAGIINTINYAKQITGVGEVYAVLGGFHLAGKENEKRIQPTISELKQINPKLIVPCHCTGWRAMCTIADALPEAFVWNSVGNLYEV